MQVHVLPILQDNYSYIVEHEGGGAIVIDPSDSKPVQRQLDDLRLRPDLILITHSHYDHTAGAGMLKHRNGCKIYGPGFDAPPADRPLAAGPLTLTALPTPGHTASAVCWLIDPPDGPAALFTGDTLFVSGCGRIMDSDAQTMYASLQHLAALPPETQVYAGHEYTEENCLFALSIAPDYPPFQKRLAEIRNLLASGRPTVPSTVAAERTYNPFLLADAPVIRDALKMPDALAWQVFAELRRRKDRFG